MKSITLMVVATLLNRRVVSIHWLEKNHLDNYVMTTAFLFTMTNEC
jgi:hypothetical protein